jgi:hypothetical protein
MAFVIRLTLAQFADVATGAEVVAATPDGTGVQIEIEERDPIYAGRIIDARGLGDPAGQDIANGTTILTFSQFMQRMAGMWPLRGLRRVAVVGDGDSGKCAVEAFLGLAPQPFMAATALDSIDRLDWYTTAVPTTCEDWQQRIRGRYQAIGRYLTPDRFGLRRLNVVRRRTRPVALPDTALIEGSTYDLVVLCTGNRESRIDGLTPNTYDDYAIADQCVVARQSYELPVFRVGPHARLPFTDQEERDGIADIAENAVSMFRTATKTAALAATLTAPTRD